MNSVMCKGGDFSMNSQTTDAGLVSELQAYLGDRKGWVSFETLKTDVTGDIADGVVHQALFDAGYTNVNSED
ncbi:MAG: hypothetical protein COB04_18720 [Gammaproteobacteria bacterium]|nr:MAG: hypothetical protein COB04_18720 [Gammaproteobacteria bacterium]